jgi:tetratricopeptide (TPR) repeat protein
MQDHRQSNDYQQAIELINEGVKLMETFQYDRAVSPLVKGMEIVKRGLASDEYEKCEKQQDEGETAGPCAVQSSACDFMETTTPDFLVNYGGVQRFVFWYPIRARPSQTWSFAKLSIVALYNLALSYHLSALKCHNSGKLSKAILLYEYTLQVQKKEGVEISAVHYLSILNNVGQIHAILDHQEQSNKAFNDLLSTMLCIVDQSTGFSDELVETWNGFMSNVLELIFKSPFPAPAA